MKDSTGHNYPAVTADVVAINIHASQFRESGAFINLILIKRKDDSDAFPSYWALPGGYIEEGESLEQCAAREFKEETGITAKMLIPSGIFSAPDRDPRGQTISASFIVILPSGDFAPLNMKAGDDAGQIGLFNLAKSYVDVQNQKVHVNAFCVENGAHIEFDATFEREQLGVIKTNISYGASTNTRLAFDHAQIIARALWQKSRVFDNTAKYAAPIAHVTPTAEQDLKAEVVKSKQD